MALVARRAIREGWRRASITSAGVCTGLLVHAAASAVGVSAILIRSATAFTVLKVIGAAYLVVLGVLSFCARREADPADVPSARSGPASFFQGFVNNLFNPKVALFYLAFLPQFIEPGDPVIALTSILVAIHIVIGLVWLIAWGWLVSRARGVLSEPRWQAFMERVTGFVLIGLGIRVATDR